MKIFLEPGSGFQNGKDPNGNEIVGSSNSDECIRQCAAFMLEQKEFKETGWNVVLLQNPAKLDAMTDEDVFVTLHLNIYRDSPAAGLRGFYRSTRHHNSEKCKALTITVVKGLRDHIDMYYHGVFNEQRDKHPQLDPIVHARGLATLVEVGFQEDFKEKINSPMVQKNIGMGLALGILRHINSRH
jgi:N-acetylmuramoyl-L-alanine amidase